MTLGTTGVVWLPRGATVNSTSLTVGTGPLPIGAAGPAWAAVAAAFADADVTLTRVGAELGLGWVGTTGGTAITALGPFIAWTQSVVAEATTAAHKATVGAGAYATALITMPSLPEIAAVQTAKVAAYTAGGAVNGSAAAAEAAEKALDLRAAAAMEAYEASTVFAALPDRFTAPPSLTSAAPTEVGAGQLATAASRTERTEYVQFSDPVRSVVDGARAVAAQIGDVLGNGDALRTAGVEAGRVVVEAATGASGVVGSATSEAASAFGHAPTVATSAYTPGTGFGAGPASAAVHSVNLHPAAGTSGAIGAGPGLGAFGTVGSVAGGVVAGGMASAGSATAGSAGSTSAGTASAGSASGATGPVRGDLRLPGDPVGAPGPIPGTGSAAARAAEVDDELDAHTDFRPTVEHFADGRTVVPAVLGADPAPGR